MNAQLPETPSVFVTPPCHVVRNTAWGEPVFFTVTNPKDKIQRVHMAGQFYEPEELEIIRQFWPGGVFCDIGSNIGNHALFALKFLGAEKVILFEPNPDAIEILMSNLVLNGVLDRCDTSHLGLGVSDEAQSGLSIHAPSRNLGAGRLVEDGGDLKTIRGDDALAGQRVQFIKIDVEGMEIKVLSGLEETIRSCHPTIFVEVDRENTASFEGWVRAHDYTIMARFKRYRTNENFLLVANHRSASQKIANGDSPGPDAIRQNSLVRPDDYLRSPIDLSDGESRPQHLLADKSGSRAVLFSAVRNEAPFLLEWVAYHRCIGFDQIVICSNPSTDGTEDILDALAAAGEIVHLRRTPRAGQWPQGAAAEAFVSEIGYRDGDWYIWLDADEFLNVHVGDKTVKSLANAVADYAGIMVNWRIFGANGHSNFPGRFIDNAFCQAAESAFGMNREVKTLFRKSDAVCGFMNLDHSAQGGFHRPFLSKDTKTHAPRFLAGSGAELTDNRSQEYRWRRGENTRPVSVVVEAEFGWQLAQINHYSVRTPEFFALKRFRGNGAHPFGKPEQIPHHSDAYFLRYDRNEAEDHTILFWQDSVTERLNNLMQRMDVAKAATNSAKLVLEDLAAIGWEYAG